MRRLALTLVATAAGAAAVVAYRPPLEREADAALTAVEGVDTGGASAVGVPASTGPDDAASGKRSKKKAARAETARPESPGTGVAWTDGTEVLTPAGLVQVRVALDAGSIRDVRVLQGPHGTRHSVWLSRQAERILRAAVVEAQSADVDMVSGATYTSTGYLESLQAALDAAEGS